MSVHFSSQSVEWSTDDKVYEELDREFNFTLDPCCTEENSKCYKFITKKFMGENGLFVSWDKEVVFMNPPYGREIGRWMHKAYRASQQGATVVCLIPSRTDTAWWHDFSMKGEIRFIRGRLKFGGHKNSAPFPSAIVIFRPKST